MTALEVQQQTKDLIDRLKAQPIIMVWVTQVMSTPLL